MAGASKLRPWIEFDEDVADDRSFAHEDEMQRIK